MGITDIICGRFGFAGAGRSFQRIFGSSTEARGELLCCTEHRLCVLSRGMDVLRSYEREDEWTKVVVHCGGGEVEGVAKTRSKGG